MPLSNEEQNEYDLDVARLEDQKKEEEETAKKQAEGQKMGLDFFVAGLVLSIIGDASEALTLGTLGWFVGLFVDFILFAMFFFSKNKNTSKQLKKIVGGAVAELIPGLNILPIRTGVMIWSFVSSRPEVLGMVGKVVKIVSKVPSPISAEAKIASKVLDVVS